MKKQLSMAPQTSRMKKQVSMEQQQSSKKQTQTHPDRPPKLDAKAQRSQEITKNCEFTQLRQQRDALMTEVHELNAHIEQMKYKHKCEVEQHNKEMKELIKLLEKQKVETDNEKSLKQVYENKVTELNIQLDKEKKIRMDLPSEKEMELSAELQGMKETLRLTELELAAAKEDKRLFLGNCAKTADGDSKLMIQQKLATQLMYKDEYINALQKQLKEVSRNKQIFEHKCIQYESNIQKIFAFNKHKCSPAEYIKQEEELIGLQIKLLEATNRNEELTIQLLEKQEELAHQAKTLRGQTTIIKVREELISMLKHKEGELSRQMSIFQKDLDARMKIVDKVQHQINEKSKEIQSLLVKLDSKEQQIKGLDQIVQAQENQLRRAQELRTRHEAMIAGLEHQLSAAIRSKKRFLIF